jgi:hypothetical protein
MKKTTKYIFIAVLSMLAISCDSSYLDVNTDPNNPLTVSPDLILPVAQRYTDYSRNYGRRTNTLGNLLMQNWSQADGYSWYQTEFEYVVNTSFYSTIWNYQYQSVLKQYNALDVEDDNYEYYQAISKIMKSYHYQILVDTYGDIPYYEALNRGNNPTPKFDDALEVYENLIVVLDEAISLINTGNTNQNVIKPGADDTMFSGDMMSWKKLANTIKLRILVRQSDMSGRESYLTTEFNKIKSEGSGFITEDVLTNPGYAQQADQQNPFWESYGQNTDAEYINNYYATCATPFVLATLDDLDDSRIDYIYEEPETGHLGVDQGLSSYPQPTGTLGEANVSNIGDGLLKDPTQSSIVFALAEAELLQAEAAFKSYLNDAQTHFNNGVAASFSYLGAPGANDYTSSNKNLADYAASTDKLEAIITQKWIALNGIDAIQSWFDYNRTGYPSNLPVSLSSPTADRPVRLMYPASEISGNSLNVPAQPNVFTDKIFWAQ